MHLVVFKPTEPRQYLRERLSENSWHLTTNIDGAQRWPVDQVEAASAMAAALGQGAQVMRAGLFPFELSGLCTCCGSKMMLDDVRFCKRCASLGCPNVGIDSPLLHIQANDGVFPTDDDAEDYGLAHASTDPTQILRQQIADLQALAESQALDHRRRGEHGLEDIVRTTLDTIVAFWELEHGPTPAVRRIRLRLREITDDVYAGLEQKRQS